MPDRRHALLFARSIRLSVVYGTVWLILFWVSGYPLEDWAVAGVVLYGALALSIEVIVALWLLGLRRLGHYARRILQKVGIEPPDVRPDEIGLGVKLMAVTMLLLLLAAVIGASIVAGIPALAWFGLTPLASYFAWISWILLCVGALGSILFLAASWVVLAALDKLASSLDENSFKGVTGFQVITENTVELYGVGTVFAKAT